MLRQTLNYSKNPHWVIYFVTVTFYVFRINYLYAKSAVCRAHYRTKQSLLSEIVTAGSYTGLAYWRVGRGGWMVVHSGSYLVAHEVLDRCNRAAGLHSRLWPGSREHAVRAVATRAIRRTPARTHCAAPTAARRPPTSFAGLQRK